MGPFNRNKREALFDNTSIIWSCAFKNTKMTKFTTYLTVEREKTTLFWIDIYHIALKMLDLIVKVEKATQFWINVHRFKNAKVTSLISRSLNILHVLTKHYTIMKLSNLQSFYYIEKVLNPLLTYSIFESFFDMCFPMLHCFCCQLIMSSCTILLTPVTAVQPRLMVRFYR